ncbi:hypothetical protein [Streptomyces sp. NPDC051992]|uniref:hypothetical protein n=1 Tax=Streptomyces sp. NPDC051992 TaxID=3161012 RepID=UPI00341A5B0E
MIVSLESLVPASGPHGSRTYADWVAVHDPDAAGTARELIEDMRTELGRSRSKPAGSSTRWRCGPDGFRRRTSRGSGTPWATG